MVLFHVLLGWTSGVRGVLVAVGINVEVLWEVIAVDVICQGICDSSFLLRLSLNVCNLP